MMDVMRFGTHGEPQQGSIAKSFSGTVSSRETDRRICPEGVEDEG